MEDDRRRWDARYEDATAGDPVPPDGLAANGLVGLVATTGRALDVACGLGRQSVWAALRGLDVDAFDVSPVAITRVRELAARHDVADRVHATVHDADDVLAGVTGPYDLVVCQRFRAPALYPVIQRLLASNGVGVVTVLSEVGTDGDPGPFHAPAGELSRAFDAAELEVLADVEQAGEATVVVRRR